MRKASRKQRDLLLEKALGIGRLNGFGDQPSAPKQIIAFIQRMDAGVRRRVAQTFLMLLATGLGFWGFSSVSEVSLTEPQARWNMAVVWKNAFRTMQLLTTQFPADLPTELPWQLQLARFAMPIFGVWIAASEVLRRFIQPFRVGITAIRGGHVVVLGDSPLACELVRSLVRSGRSVLASVPSSSATGLAALGAAGAATVPGRATDPATLRRLCIRRAGTVVVTDDMGAAAVTLLSAVASANRNRSTKLDPLKLVFRIARHNLQALLSTATATLSQRGSLDVKFQVVERSVARSLLTTYPVDWGCPPHQRDLHAVILGLGEMGTELLMQIARVAVPLPGKRSVVTVVDKKAETLEQRMLKECPGLLSIADIRFFEQSVEPDAANDTRCGEWLLAPRPADAIYICCGDDNMNFSIALKIRQLYETLNHVVPPTFVYQRNGDQLVEGLRSMHSRHFDAWRVIAFGSIVHQANPYFLIEDGVDRLAQRIHEEYLEHSSSGAAAVPWRALPEGYRSANRSKADHVISKLRTLSAHASQGGAASADCLAGADIEQLAAQEHDRWCRERLISGWTLGAKEESSRRTPYLVNYEKLTEEVKDYNRRTILELSKVLEQVGVGLRKDFRVGLWLGTNASPHKLLETIVDAIGIDDVSIQSKHLQLVLPFRSMLEPVIVRHLAQLMDLGIDIARSCHAGHDWLEVVDQVACRELVYAADRAFVLENSINAGEPRTEFVRFLDVCDRVLVDNRDVSWCELEAHAPEIAENRKISLLHS